MNLTIKNKHDEKIAYAYHEGDSSSNTIVLIGHGVTGNMDRPMILGLANALQQTGLNALRFSFSGNGDSEGDFRTSCISKETEDLGSIIDALEGKNITYIGHSMGGAVGVLRTASDPRIKAFVSLAGMVHTADFVKREFGDITPDEGFMWDQPENPLSSIYVNDLYAIDNVIQAAEKITVPYLIVHGKDDDTVPLSDSEAIHSKSNAELIVIDKADHVFSEAALEIMCNTVTNWLKQQRPVQ